MSCDGSRLVFVVSSLGVLVVGLSVCLMDGNGLFGLS